MSGRSFSSDALRQARRTTSRADLALFPHQPLLQLGGAAERGVGQLALLGGGERCFELRNARHADEDGADAGMRQRIARRRLAEALRVALLDQRPEALGALEIGGVGSTRADRRRWRACHRMAFGRAGERAARQHANADRTGAAIARLVEQPAVILSRIILWQR